MIAPRTAVIDCPHKDRDLSCSSYYELIRAQIYHEDELINNRLSWLIQSQTIFMAAYAVIITSPYGNLQSVTDPYFAIVRATLIGVGVMLTMIVLVAVRAALKMMKTSVTLLIQNCPPAAEPGGGLLPDLAMTDRLHKDGMLPAQSFPLIFLAAWVFIGIVEISEAFLPHLKR